MRYCVGDCVWKDCGYGCSFLGVICRVGMWNSRLMVMSVSIVFMVDRLIFIGIMVV